MSQKALEPYERDFIKFLANQAKLLINQQNETKSVKSKKIS